MGDISKQSNVSILQFYENCSNKRQFLSEDWSGLPRDLLERILKRLVLLRDHLGFSSVCSSWRSVAVENRHCIPPQFPALLLPGVMYFSNWRPLFQAFQHRDGDELPLLPVSHRNYCCGTNFGWVILVTDQFDMQLLNPVSRVKIQLPSMKTLPHPIERFTRFCKYYVRKAVLSCDPCKSIPAETLVLVICGLGRILAFAKLGDEVWTPIKSIGRRDYVDAIYYNQMFYAIYNPGGVVACDIANSSPRVTDYAGRPRGEIFWQTRYLVESQGEFYQLRRTTKYDKDDSYIDNSDSDHDDDDDYLINNFDDDNEVDSDVDDHNGEGNDQHGDSDNNDGNRTANDRDGESSNHGGNEDSSSADVDDDSSNDSGSDDQHVGNEDDRHNESGGGWNIENVDDRIRYYRTLRFKVFKMTKSDPTTCQRGWEKVENIGDNAFFVGYNSSVSLRASDVLGCKPNSIYFTDSHTPVDYRMEPIRHDIGVFNLEDRSVEEVYPIDTKPMWPPAIWFTPAPFAHTPQFEP